MAIGLKLRNLLFVVHTVAPERVERLCPRGIELDVRPTPQGPRAFLATVTSESSAAFPYVMTGFRQVYYRVFVRHQREPGVLVVRSWVSARTTAAVLSLAVPTEYAQIEISVDDSPAPYSRYSVQARSGERQLQITAAADPAAGYPGFSGRDEAVPFLTHRLNAFAAGSHPRTELSVIRFSHPPMSPMPARVDAMSAGEWTADGILTPEEASRPLLALIQPEIQFEMNLPEKIEP